MREGYFKGDCLMKVEWPQKGDKGETEDKGIKHKANPLSPGIIVIVEVPKEQAHFSSDENTINWLDSLF